jgi:hypothetical protein
VSTKFTIPASPGKLREELKRLGRVVQEYEWKRAGAVDALVREPDEPEDGRLTPNQFAKLGIRGLKSTRAITQYKQAWRKAVAAGIAEPAKLGATVTLPDVDWREWAGEPDATAPWRVGGPEVAARYAEEAEAAGTTVGMAVRAGSNRPALVAAIMADEKVEKAAWEAIQKKDAAKHRRARDHSDAVTCDFGPLDPEEDLVGSLVEGAVKEAGRRELLDYLEQLSEQVLASAQRLKDEHAYTGVHDEVEQVHRIGHNLSEAQWVITGFAVEQEA